MISVSYLISYSLQGRRQRPNTKHSWNWQTNHNILCNKGTTFSYYKMCRDCSSKQSRKDPEYKWRHVLVRSRSITLGKTLKVRSLRKKFLYCLLAQTKTIILRNFLEPAVSSTIWGSYIIGYELFCWCSSSIWLFY